MSAALQEQPEELSSAEGALASATAPRCSGGSRPAALTVATARPRQADAGSRRPPGRRPTPPTGPLRARLVPTAGAATTPRQDGPAHQPPPTVRDKICVMRSSDRSVVLECADEDRGEVPAADPAVVARRLAVAAVEVILGSRPAAQLARWLTPGVLQALRMRADLHRRAVAGEQRTSTGSRPPAVRRAHVCMVEPHVVEAAVVVDDSLRVRAVAVRLETHRGVWRATALDVG